ncbi:hypothetical protein Y032_0813g2480 [Ancylostoma ceylanicum]|uniref:Uncharacterized protein n=1 Tax=Ancylostoma ceylanicum TaxID=53326 RepID=A0A016WD56_9BILA|nr:hypothetical protein Y032_0813g2480 [Ancylostoma ceylanicum]
MVFHIVIYSRKKSTFNSKHNYYRELQTVVDEGRDRSAGTLVVCCGMALKFSAAGRSRQPESACRPLCLCPRKPRQGPALCLCSFGVHSTCFIVLFVCNNVGCCLLGN